MKAWKRRFKRFEGFYAKGELRKRLLEDIAKKDGPEVLRNWFEYCRETHGEVYQPSLDQNVEVNTV